MAIIIQISYDYHCYDCYPSLYHWPPLHIDGPLGLQEAHVLRSLVVRQRQLPVQPVPEGRRHGLWAPRAQGLRDVLALLQHRPGGIAIDLDVVREVVGLEKELGALVEPRG